MMTMNLPPWSRRRVSCSMCGKVASLALWFPKGDVPLSGYACEVCAEDLCRRFAAIAQTNVNVTPVRWTWPQWRWVQAQRWETCKTRWRAAVRRHAPHAPHPIDRRRVKRAREWAAQYPALFTEAPRSYREEPFDEFDPDLGEFIDYPYLDEDDD